MRRVREQVRDFRDQADERAATGLRRVLAVN